MLPRDVDLELSANSGGQHVGNSGKLHRASDVVQHGLRGGGHHGDHRSLGGGCRRLRRCGLALHLDSIPGGKGRSGSKRLTKVMAMVATINGD